jgi:hypothetical protein
MPIFPPPINLAADYDWSGLHTFEFPATFEAGINTEAITSSGNLVTTVVSGGQGQYFFGANPIYLMSATEFRPAEALTAVSLGSAARRWTNVYSVDGDFSGDVTATTVIGTVNLFLQSNSGTAKIGLANSGSVSINAYNVVYQQFTAAGVFYRKDCAPTFNGTTSLGLTANRWSNTYSVDGSFSGNLTSEVGGSYKLYNLGGDGDTDTEYLELSASANVFTLEAKKSGSGVVRDFNVKANDGDFSGTLKTGGFKTAIGGTLSTSITLTASDHTILGDCQLNNISVNLPTAVGIDGQVFVIKKVDSTSNFITVFASGSETIDGASIHIINTANESIQIQAYSGAWFII